MTAVRRLAGRARRILRKLRARGVSDTAYWERRAAELGPRAVFNRRHGDGQLSAVTDKQKGVLYPLFREALDGSERDILDFGCGHGRFSADLAAITGGHVVGVDPVEALLELAPRSEAVTYRPMTPGRIPVADNGVDVIWVCLVLGGITGTRALKRTAREIERILRPGGMVFLVENTAEKPSTEHWVFRSTEEYRRLLPALRLQQVGEYEDLGERMSVLVGRSARNGDRASLGRAREQVGPPTSQAGAPAPRL